MGAQPSPSVRIEDVPLHLAALSRQEFKWARTPRLQQTSISMRSLCIAVMDHLQACSSQADLLKKHQGVTAETVFTLLKHGGLSMAGKCWPENVQKEIVWRLNAMLKPGAISLDADHPFANDSAIVSASTSLRTKTTLTGTKKVPHTSYHLKTQSGYEEALKYLRDEPVIQAVLKKDLSEVLSPTGATVVRLQHELRNALNENDDEEHARMKLLETVIAYANKRYPSLAQGMEQDAAQYMKYVDDMQVDADGPDDEVIVMLKYLFKQAGQSRDSEKGLRKMIMSSIIMMAYDSPPTMKADGLQVSREEVLRAMYEQWKNALSRSKIPIPEEMEFAAFALICRLDPMEKVRSDIEFIEAQPGQ